MRGSKVKTRESARDFFYFSDRLRSRLGGMDLKPVTIVEAPSGFGKTTAIREYLRGKHGAGTNKYWHTCLGEPPSRTWACICSLFAEAAPGVGDGLRGLYPPTAESLPDIAALVRKCRCDTPFFLVIDNYQLFDNEIRQQIVSAFSVHGDENLHVVFITQPLPPSRQSAHDVNIHRIGSADFLFDSGDVAKFCTGFGIKLTKKERDYIQKISGGWIAAIRLQAENYKETGLFVRMGGMDGLVETAIWNRIALEEREFLMAVSLLDGFTPRQAAIMGGAPSLSENFFNLLRQNLLTPYSEEKGVYYMHAILRDYLGKRFDCADDRYRAEMLRRAAAACEYAAEYFAAAQFYMQLRDYDAILRLPLTHRNFFNHPEARIAEFFEQLLDACDESVLRKHPVAVLTIGKQFFKLGMLVPFARVAASIQRLIDDPEGLPANDLLLVRGEFAMMKFFTAFNDIEKMSEYHREAYDCLKRLSDPPRSVISHGNVPWSMGVPSVLFLYWRKPGELDRTLSVMDDCLPRYVALAGGHGAGGECVLRAERNLNRGDDEAAEAMCHKAIFEARGAEQDGNVLCAELTLARIAILRGDWVRYGEARERIFRETADTSQIAVRRMGELCLASLDVVFGYTRDLPEWIRDTKKIRRALYTMGHPYALTLHASMLTIEGAHAKLYGLTDPIMESARRLNYIMPQIYQHIFAAAAKNADGRADEARGHVREALGMALADEIYLPFAEHGAAVTHILKDLRGGEYACDKTDALFALIDRWTAGVAAVRASLPPNRPTLTPRQNEIARMTRDGLSAKKIATELFISENTVKSTQRLVYEKLGIHSKGELKHIEF